MERERIRRFVMDAAQVVAGVVLRATGLRGLTARNTLDYRVVRREAGFADLPPGFEGFRVLQLSDLHIDGIVDGGRTLFDLLEMVDCDLCVLTGDYRFGCSGDCGPAIALMRQLIERIRSRHGIIGILGDHDELEMAPRFEEMGVRLLLNDATPLARDQQTIWIAGVDGRSRATSDVSAAMTNVPEGAFTILLAHSPESAPQGASYGADFCLAGHTHGGQLCLPFGIPIVTNARSPRRRARGEWTVGDLRGFTSRGIGASGLQARLFCPPEIVLHELRIVAEQPSGEEALPVEATTVGASAPSGGSGAGGRSGVEHVT